MFKKAVIDKDNIMKDTQFLRVFAPQVPTLCHGCRAQQLQVTQKQMKLILKTLLEQ